MTAPRFVYYRLPGPATLPTGATSLLSRDLTVLPLERLTRPSRSTFGTGGISVIGFPLCVQT